MLVGGIDGGADGGRAEARSLTAASLRGGAAVSGDPRTLLYFLSGHNPDAEGPYLEAAEPVG